jgi:hypothetical protein
MANVGWFNVADVTRLDLLLTARNAPQVGIVIDVIQLGLSCLIHLCHPIEQQQIQPADQL